MTGKDKPIEYCYTWAGTRTFIVGRVMKDMARADLWVRVDSLRWVSQFNRDEDYPASSRKLHDWMYERMALLDMLPPEPRSQATREVTIFPQYGVVLDGVGFKVDNGQAVTDFLQDYTEADGVMDPAYYLIIPDAEKLRAIRGDYK